MTLAWVKWVHYGACYHFIRIIKYNFYCSPLSAPPAECGMFPRLSRPGRTSKCREIRWNKRAQWTHNNSAGCSRRWSLNSTSLECRVSCIALSQWFESKAGLQLENKALEMPNAQISMILTDYSHWTGVSSPDADTVRPGMLCRGLVISNNM